MVPPEASLRWLRHEHPADGARHAGRRRTRSARCSPDEQARALGPLEPREPQPLWWAELTYLQPDAPPAQTRYLTFALTARGERIGWVNFYLPAAPASIVSLITRGNQGMFARMAELLQPARHETAILFADIQASTQLGRHLSSQRWFELIRDFMTEADQAVITRARDRRPPRRRRR